jgi:periplasmic copper chaperone A
MRSSLTRMAVVAGAVGALTLAIAAPASAHVTVNPNTATQGGYTKVTFRVPNETTNADTTRLEVNLPTDAPVASVSLKPVSGWNAVAQKSKLATPIKSHDTEITEAVSRITWTAQPGAVIKPGQFQEFDVSLGPLPTANQMIFKALQTYSDGSIVRWIDEPAADGSEVDHPAPVLKLTPAAATGAAAPAAVAGPATTDTSDDSGNTGIALGITGIVLGLAGLVLGLLAYRRSARTGAAAAPAAAESEKVSAN